MIIEILGTIVGAIVGIAFWGALLSIPFVFVHLATGGR